MPEKPMKTGVLQGSIAEDGTEYLWSVGIYQPAYDEAIGILGEAGYSHFANQVRELATQPDPRRSDTVDVRAVEDCFEIRDHGGVVGNINVRVFFGVDNQRRAIVVLGTIKKQNDGPTPLGDKVRMRRRWRQYREGQFGFL